MDEHSWSAALNWALLNESLDLITQVANKVLLNSTPEQISEMRMFDAVSAFYRSVHNLRMAYGPSAERPKVSLKRV